MRATAEDSSTGDDYQDKITFKIAKIWTTYSFDIDDAQVLQSERVGVLHADYGWVAVVCFTDFSYY